MLARFIVALILILAAASAHAILPIPPWETGNGARVYFVESRDLPIIDVAVEFPAGAGHDPKAKAGLAGMTNRVLRLGARHLNEDEIARGFADVGAIMNGRFDTDRAGVALRTLSSEKERARALTLLATVLQQPTFPQEVLEREKVRSIAAIKESNTKPETIAAVNFNRLVFRDHPYGQRQSGEVKTVESLTRDDLVKFYREHYVARHAVVAIMGDLTREQAAAVAERLTTGLVPGDAQPPVLPVVDELADAYNRRISHPATQSHILVGAPSIRRTDPDYFPMLVGNYVLGGGGFVSRLMDEVRQKRGLAYSAYSTFSALQRKGSFVIGMQTRREQTDEALKVVDATLRDFLAKGPTEQELVAAKKNLVGSFPLRIDSNAKILEYLALIGFYRLPLTYLEDFQKNVERVTAEEVRAVFSRHLDAARLVTVVVGAAAEQTAARAGE